MSASSRSHCPQSTHLDTPQAVGLRGEDVPLEPTLSWCGVDAASLAIGLFYLGVVVFLFTRHVPWRDEAQGWMRMQSLSSLRDYFIIPGGEGHPPLWYWVLRVMGAFVELDHAVWLAPVLAAVACALAAWLLRGRPLFLSAVLFSAPFMLWAQEFRPFVLGAVFVLAALVFLRRKTYPACAACLGLACFSHLFFFFALPLFIGEEFLRCRSVTVLKWAALPCLAAAGLILVSGSGNSLSVWEALHGPVALLACGELLQGFGFTLSPAEFAAASPWLLTTAPLVLAAALWFSFGRNLYAVLTGGCLFSMALFLGVLQLKTIDHAEFLCFLLIVAGLIRLPEIRSEALLVLLYLSDVQGLTLAQKLATQPLSGAEAAYDYVRSARPAGLKLLAVDDALLTPAAYKHHFKYYSLPMERETDGLIDWSNHRVALDQFRRGYAAAGCPKAFLLAIDHSHSEKSPVGKNGSGESAPVIRLCGHMHWDCRLAHSESKAIFDQIDLYLVHAGASAFARRDRGVMSSP
jgi:hypothetical protein